jgi:hypothetical protein
MPKSWVNCCHCFSATPSASLGSDDNPEDKQDDGGFIDSDPSTSEPHNVTPPPQPHFNPPGPGEDDSPVTNSVLTTPQNDDSSSLPPAFGEPVAIDDKSTTSSEPPTLETSDSAELLEIKKEALQQLSPLVGHLDQSPEEKFKTMMMMIQASDDHSLIKSAYETARQLPDDKARAQALLDVVNEINYFTHSSKSGNSNKSS